LSTEKTIVKLGLLALGGVILVNSGLLSQINQRLRITSLLDQFRKQEEQDFMMKVEDAAAASTPALNNEALPAGGL